MKKIGILTFHRSINYGAFMQCFSLAEKLKQKFPNAEIEVIDYASKIMDDHYKPRLTLSFLRHLQTYRLTKKRYQNFQEALKYLPLSDYHKIADGCTEDILQDISKMYDIVIVGSDAVWNWVKRGFPNPYLLGNGLNCVKLSYAASAYGMDKMQHVGEAEREYFGQALAGFSFIGVRDAYTMSLVCNMCPTAQPVFTCDPTVFLNVNHIRQLIGVADTEAFRNYLYKRYGLPKDKKLIGFMGGSDALAEKIKMRYGDAYTLVSLYIPLKNTDCHLLQLTPMEWALIFSIFDVTVTNYFHGTLLSLRNGTPVISMDYTEFSKKNEGKIHDVMRRMQLEDCHFDHPQDAQAMMQQLDAVMQNLPVYREKVRDGISMLEKSADSFFSALEAVL